MAKLISISLLDEEISVERLMEALNKLSSRDLRKYFKRKKMVFPRNVRYAFLTKCIKREFLAVQKDLLDSNNRVFTEFELVEFYKCVENEVLAQEFKKDFLAYFVNKTYKNLLTDKNLADLYSIAETKEEVANESIYSFLVGLNPIFTDTEENNLDCLPVETTAQRLKDQFTLFEVREFARKYGVIVPKYPNAEQVAPIVIEKAEARQLLDEEGLAYLQGAEANVLLSFAKKHGIYVPRYLKKDEMIDEIISQISSKEIDNNKISEVFNENLITFKSRSSNLTLCDLLDKYQNLDDLSEVRNDNSKDMSPLKRCAVGGAIGIELRYNEENRKARLLERRKKLELLRQQALERKEQLARERKEQELIAQSEASSRLAGEEEARRIAAEQRIAELEAALREEEEKRLAAERALEELNRDIPEEEPEAEEPIEEEEENEVVTGDELVTPEYFESTVQEEYDIEETKDVTVMEFETVEEEVEEPVVEEVIETVSEEPVVEEVTETVSEEPLVEEESISKPNKCPVRKTQMIWLIILAVVLVAVGVLYALNSEAINAQIAFYCENELVKWVVSDNANEQYLEILKQYGILFGALLFVVLVISFLLRVILHPIGCKTKKQKHCCYKCEWYKYVWTVVFVGLGLVALLAFVPIGIGGKAYNFGIDKIVVKIQSVFTELDKVDWKNPEIIVLFSGLGLFVLGLIGLIICNISHVKREKAKLAALESEVSVEEPVEEVVEEVVEEEEERLLFTTFEEAKLAEDLNDLNRMIGKVNEHVKDLSAIQARLYNELVGEEEIIVEPVIEETHIVIPSTPTDKPTLVVEEKNTAEVAVPSEETKGESVVTEENSKEKKNKVKKEKTKCPVRKTQMVWLIVLTVVLVAVGVLYALNSEVINAQIAFYCENDLVKWVVSDNANEQYLEILKQYGILFGALLFVVLVISFLLRVILHPIGCKAKKQKHCCYKCEWHKYVWTVVFVGLGLVALLAFVPIEIGGKAYNFGIDKIVVKIQSVFAELDKVDWKNPEIIVLFSGLGLFALGFIILTIVTFVHLSNDKKRNKVLEESQIKSEEEKNSIENKNSNTTQNTPSFQEGVAYLPYMVNGSIQMVPVSIPNTQCVNQVPVANGIQPVYIYSQMANAGAANHVATYANPYNPGIYEDIESPYNMYRTGKETTSYRSRRGLGFLKFLGALVVLVAAYVFLAYKIESIDFLNLFKH